MAASSPVPNEVERAACLYLMYLRGMVISIHLSFGFTMGPEAETMVAMVAVVVLRPP
ncbi:MAG TPA: hypothetical protein HPP66_05435 [Planctomycetes bacterium]|nr:hypothetical protein [Planctomycetota bacterium]